ncbi:MBL fold metallo-hydrolase [Moraxellaceae bacterium AER2_44_116]|nr:MBL fold metallo-hydrolase [Moraxellaceae bacterium]TQC94885.1 MBL fold metallo-hydrolase [Moraxellaceae bacterium AER2_44_116]
MSTLQIQHFLDTDSETYSYVVSNGVGTKAAIIDPVLDYDPKSGRTRTDFADSIIAYIRKEQLTVEWILETHAHADHISSAHYLREQVGGKIAIGEKITQVQGVFKKVFNLGDELATDGRQFDYLFKDGEHFQIGELTAQVLLVAGHTPADVAYVIEDAMFVGDTLFMPDVGTARCDFPQGDARVLYQSIKRILDFPDDTRLFMCHDYPPKNQRPHQYLSIIAEQKALNIHLLGNKCEADFVAMRQARDATLAMPRLIIPSIQVNIRAGEFPPIEDNGVAYLKVPLNLLGKKS